PIHLEQLDKAPVAELGQTIRCSHAVVMGRAWSQCEAELFVPRGRAIEVANGQHYMIDWTPGRHMLPPRPSWSAHAITGRAALHKSESPVNRRIPRRSSSSEIKKDISLASFLVSIPPAMVLEFDRSPA